MAEVRRSASKKGASRGLLYDKRMAYLLRGMLRKHLTSAMKRSSIVSMGGGAFPGTVGTRKDCRSGVRKRELCSGGVACHALLGRGDFELIRRMGRWGAALRRGGLNALQPAAALRRLPSLSSAERSSWSTRAAKSSGSTRVARRGRSRARAEGRGAPGPPRRPRRQSGVRRGARPAAGAGEEEKDTFGSRFPRVCSQAHAVCGTRRRRRRQGTANLDVRPPPLQDLRHWEPDPLHAAEGPRGLGAAAGEHTTRSVNKGVHRGMH